MARTGICLSILLPILCCEFRYLNLVALPAYHTKVWITTIEAQFKLRAPSFALITRSDEDGNQPLVSISDICNREVASRPNRLGCLDPPQNVTFEDSKYIWQYHLYDASKKSYFISITRSLHILANVTCKFTSNSRPTSELTQQCRVDARYFSDLTYSPIYLLHGLCPQAYPGYERGDTLRRCFPQPLPYPGGCHHPNLARAIHVCRQSRRHRSSQSAEKRLQCEVFLQISRLYVSSGIWWSSSKP